MSSQTREKLESLLLVTVITVLVWLYAEGEVIKPFRERVPVKFVTPRSDLSLVIEPNVPTGDGGVLTTAVTFRASAGQMQSVRRQITDQGAIEIPVEAPDPDQLNGSQQTFTLRQRLAASRLGQLGVNIADVDPATVRVHVEAMKTVPLTIRVDAGDLPLAEPPSVTPVEAPVRVPASAADRLRNGQVIAEIDPVRLREREPDEPLSLTVGLALPPWLQGDHIELLRETATVNLTLEKQTEAIVLESVPIRINAPAGVLERYTLHLPRGRRQVRGVTLVGPADAIERIRAGDFEVWAELRPTLEQLRSGEDALQPHIRRPQGVGVSSSLPSISLRLERRGQ